jgi:hypothetical protein
MLTLRAGVTELRAKAHEQQQHIEALRRRMNQKSTNASRPPSQDPPAVKRRPQVSGQDPESRCGGIAYARFCAAKPAA